MSCKVVLIIIFSITLARCYYLSSNLFNFAEGVSFCQNQCKSSVASIHNITQFGQIKQIIEVNTTSNHQNIYIGLTGNISNGFYWFDGTQFDFGNNISQNTYSWTDGKPNNDGQCVELLTNDYKWNDIPCTEERYVLCNDCDALCWVTDTNMVREGSCELSTSKQDEWRYMHWHNYRWWNENEILAIDIRVKIGFKTLVDWASMSIWIQSCNSRAYLFHYAHYDDDILVSIGWMGYNKNTLIAKSVLNYTEKSINTNYHTLSLRIDKQNDETLLFTVLFDDVQEISHYHTSDDIDDDDPELLKIIENGISGYISIYTQYTTLQNIASIYISGTPILQKQSAPNCSALPTSSPTSISTSSPTSIPTSSPTVPLTTAPLNEYGINITLTFDTTLEEEDIINIVAILGNYSLEITKVTTNCNESIEIDTNNGSDSTVIYDTIRSCDLKSQKELISVYYEDDILEKQIIDSNIGNFDIKVSEIDDTEIVTTEHNEIHTASNVNIIIIVLVGGFAVSLVCGLIIICGVIIWRKKNYKLKQKDTEMIIKELEETEVNSNCVVIKKANYKLKQKDTEMIIKKVEETEVNSNSVVIKKAEFEEIEIENIETKGNVSFNNDEIRIWLKDSVGMEFVKYYENFIQNGYETIDFIKPIISIEELKDIGIEIEKDQKILLTKIEELRAVGSAEKTDGNY